MRFSIITGIMLVLLSCFAVAGYDITILTPNDNSVVETQPTNLSFYVVITGVNPGVGNGVNGANYTLFINGAKISTAVNFTNNTQVSVLRSQEEGAYWWFLNITNGSTYTLSEEYNYSVNMTPQVTLQSSFTPTTNQNITNRYVNHSFTVSVTRLKLWAGTALNVTLWRNGVKYAGPFNVTNGTQFSIPRNETNGAYYWQLNVSNGTFSAMTQMYNYTVAETAPTSYALTMRAPPQYQIFSDSSSNVNISWELNVTNGFLGNPETLSCGIYNRSGVSGAFQRTEYSMTNASFANQTISFVAGNPAYHTVYVNCTSTYNANQTVYLSSRRTFSVVTTGGPSGFFRYMLSINGSNSQINFTLNTGNLDLGGNLTAVRLRLRDISTGPTDSCTVPGTFAANISSGKLLYCNSTGTNGWRMVTLT